MEVLDGRPLGEGRISHITDLLKMQTGLLHRETIQFYIINSPILSLILGLPWLRRQDPHIAWRGGKSLSGAHPVTRAASPTNRSSQSAPSHSLSPNQTFLDFPRNMLISLRLSVRPRLPSFDRIVPGTVQSNSCLALLLPRGEFSHYHSLNLTP